MRRLIVRALAAEQTPEEEAAAHLSKVRRIYIAILTGGDAALQLRDLLMTSLHNSKQFVITEDEDKADATLKGAGDDDVFTDTFQSSEGINAHTQIGSSSSEGLRNYANSSSSHSGGLTIGENDSRRDEQRKHEAIATVRLVSKDGDVIWSATAESMGAKFLGASADVADKIAKRLVTDYKAAKLEVGKSAARHQPTVASDQPSKATGQPPAASHRRPPSSSTPCSFFRPLPIRTAEKPAMSAIAPAPPTANPNRAERTFRLILIVFAAFAGLTILGHLGMLLWAQNGFTGGECVVAAHASMLAHDGTLYYDFHHYPYTVAPYTPLFYLLDAGLQKAGLPIYTAGRIISFAAALGIVALSWYLTLLYTKERYSAAMCALLCASSSLLFVWGTVGQVDVLALFWALAAFYLYSRYNLLGEHTLIWAGACALLAFFTKQTMLACPAAICLLLFFTSRKMTP